MRNLIIFVTLSVFGNTSLALDRYESKILGSEGEEIGNMVLTQGTVGVLINIKAEKLEAGKHGMHFHAVGACDDAKDGFKHSGAHIMPSGKAHGYFNQNGPHEGNLPNLVVDENGKVEVELYTDLVALKECSEGDKITSSLSNLNVHVDTGVPNAKTVEVPLNIETNKTKKCLRPALLDSDGSALIIHKNPDDHTTQPIGGSGDRIACALIKN